MRSFFLGGTRTSHGFGVQWMFFKKGAAMRLKFRDIGFAFLFAGVVVIAVVRLLAEFIFYVLFSSRNGVRRVPVG